MKKGIVIMPGFYFYLAAGLLLIPIRWFMAMLTAAAFHELFHFLALKLCACQVFGVRLGAFGAKIDAQCDRAWKSAFCALAGPSGGLLLLVLAPVAPRVALCGLAQSVYNLLPVSPLDGSTAVLALLQRFFPRKLANRIAKALEQTVLICILAIAAYSCIVLKLGLISVVLAIVLLIQKKYLANKAVCEYNRLDCRNEVLK